MGIDRKHLYQIQGIFMYAGGFKSVSKNNKIRTQPVDGRWFPKGSLEFPPTVMQAIEFVLI